MSRINFFAGVLVLAFILCSLSINAEPARVQSKTVMSPLHMLVVFTKFNGENDELTEPPDWAEELFSGEPGSIPYYFNEISFGDIVMTGEFLPTLYELPKTAEYYSGSLNEFSLTVMDLLDNDPDVDFSRYDNDGPDGIPGSEDDDRYVDYMVIMPVSRPVDLINGLADGQSGLAIASDYVTSDTNSEGKSIKLDYNSGCIATAPNFNQAVGLISHEYLHFYNTADLYDTKYTLNSNFEEDSAGIGYWGVMGRGILGWDGKNAPVGPCAYTRMKMGYAGKDNAYLVDLYGVHHGLRAADSGLPTGKIYRIWVTDTEYFLIENRRNDHLYCEQNNPANGLMIWHVNERGENMFEENKRVDLECPDGLYSDAGYPLGVVANPDSGRDNLDFWAHNQSYRDAHVGNFGDATDVYDGITYTRFGPDTNPNSNSAATGKPTGIDIFNIHPEGEEMVFDVYATPHTGWISAVPPIGVAYQRFAIGSEADVSAEKTRVLYLVDTVGGRSGDLLITEEPDALTVDEISELDPYSTQRLIEARIYDGGVFNVNAMITRENLLPEELADVAALYAVDLEQLCGGEPRSVQKLTLETGTASAPEAFVLGQNYPNPFNSVTAIPFTLAEPGQAVLEVFNVLGQRVCTIDSGMLPAGRHMIHFDASEFSTGMYLYRMKGEGLAAGTRTMMYIK